MGGADGAEVIVPLQHMVGASKPLDNDPQPADNQVRGYQTVRINLRRCAKKALLPLLAPSITQKQRPYNRCHRVLEIRNQLDRQQRKSPSLPPTQKTRNRNPLLLEIREEINRTTPVRGYLTITIKGAADGTARTNK